MWFSFLIYQANFALQKFIYIFTYENKFSSLDINKKYLTSSDIGLVGLSGLEPPPPTLSGWCSNRLSYNPIYLCFLDFNICLMVEIIGFEPMTPCLQGKCSSQLSYTPKFNRSIIISFFFVVVNNFFKFLSLKYIFLFFRY